MVLTPFLWFYTINYWALLHNQLLGIGVTYEMRNISIHWKDSLDTFRVCRRFHFEAIWQKITQILSPQFEGGVGKNFFDPNISPSFGLRGLKFFRPLDIYETHFHLEFQNPNPTNGVWGGDHGNKKIHFFLTKRGLFQNSSHSRFLNVDTFWEIYSVKRKI